MSLCYERSILTGGPFSPCSPLGPWKPCGPGVPGGPGGPLGPIGPCIDMVEYILAYRNCCMVYMLYYA